MVHLSSRSGSDPTQVDRKKPVGVYFGSFQDLFRARRCGQHQYANEWLHKVNWDLVVFDEYHFGAWRDSAKELFEGEEDAGAQKAGLKKLRRRCLERMKTVSSRCRERIASFANHHAGVLYLSGTPFKALATGEFIEEQIFNWTYTDEQRAKADLKATHEVGTRTARCRRCGC